MLKVSLRTIHLWVEKGDLQAWKTPGGHRKITLASVQKLQQQQSKVAESSRPAFQVVIIEDNEAQRKIYQQIFDHLDLAIDIHLAENGYAGLIAIGKYNPDLVITDLMMPAMDGFQMIEEIQKQPELRELNIIIISALNESDVRSHDKILNPKS